MKAVFLHIFLSALIIQAKAQTIDPAIESRLADLPGVTENLQTFEQFGVKEPATQALENTGTWLFQFAENLGYDVEFDSFKDPLDRWQRNVVVSIPGTMDDYFIVVGAHFDTRRGTGTNDNGSGVVALLNTLKVLTGYQPTYGIRMVFFSGEEQGFHGSTHYVDDVLSGESGDLLLMLNVDQIGGTAGAEGNDKIFCERDENNEPASNNESSNLITDTLSELTKLYTSLEPVLSKAFGSDYEPFEDAGEVITGLYQFAPYPFTHTVSDSLQYLDTNSLKQAVRLVTAATMYFSGQKTLNVDQVFVPGIALYPNPSSGRVYCAGITRTDHVDIFNLHGVKISRLVLENGWFDISELQAGIYIAVVSEREKLFHTRLVVQ